MLDEKPADEVKIAAEAVPEPEEPAAPPSGKAEPARFRAVTPLGDIFFTIRSAGEVAQEGEPDADFSVLRAAQQLGRAEPLLCMLEEWLELPLDFSPGSHTEPDAGRLEVTLSPALPDSDGDMTKAVLCLPQGSFSRLSPPPPELAKQMRWGMLPCQLEMANIALSPQQLGRLEIGGMVLIPASFESFWRCQVRISNANPSPVFPAELDAGRKRLIFDLFEPSPEQISHTAVREPAESETVPDNPGGELITIVLQYLPPVPADRLFGWAEQPVFALGHLLSGAGAVLYRSGKPLADGELVPVGNGYGVLIKNVVNEAEK